MIMNDGACVVVEVEKKVKFIMKWKKCEPILCICCWFHPFVCVALSKRKTQTPHANLLERFQLQMGAYQAA